MATVVLAAELVRAGQTVVWLCAKPEGVRALRDELQLVEDQPVKAKRVTSSVAAELEDSQLVTIFGSSEFLLQSLHGLADWSDRIVVLKNMDAVLNVALWATLKPHRRLVLAGDLTAMQAPIQDVGWPTKLAFSPYPAMWNIIRPALPSFVGEMIQNDSEPQHITLAEYHQVKTERGVP